MKEFKHFDLKEREKIEKFLRKRKSLRWIAWAIDRSVSGVSDEVKNNSVKGRNNAKKAEHKAYVKRQTSKRDCLKVAMNSQRRKRGASVSSDGRTFIDQRPKRVLKRLEFGHFEGDFIDSGKDGQGSLLVLVERKKRYPFLAYLDDRS